MYTIDTSIQAVSRLVSSSDTTPEAVSAYKSLMIPVKSYRPPLPENFSVTVMKMYLLKHACMSVNMPECSSATFVHGTILGRFDQRLRRQGKWILQRHIACRLRTLQRGVVSAVLSIYEYKCIKAFTSQSVDNKYIYYLQLFRIAFLVVLIFAKARPRSSPPPPNSRVVPTSLLWEPRCLDEINVNRFLLLASYKVNLLITLVGLGEKAPNR